MIEVLEKSSGKCIGFRMNGTLVHADYAKLVPMLEEMLAEHGSLRCLCEISDFRGITPHALWDEIKFDVKHCSQIERCAIVGDRALDEWMAKVASKIFRKAEMRYFDTTQADEAWQWLTEGAQCCCGCTPSSQAETTN